MNRSSVYYRPKTPDEEAKERKEKIMARIDWWSTQNPTWGARKIRQLLRTEGYLVSRKTVGWKLSDTLSTKAVLDAVREAVKTHGTPAIINSDQGSQFTSDEYKALLKELHIRQSMDGRRRWADNIMIERWFRSLKTEKLYVEEFETERELKACIEDYISQYNTVRPHMALGYETPAVVFAANFSASA